MMQKTGACRVDDLTIDFARRKVHRDDGEEIRLSALSFDTLNALIEASPATLSVSELIDRAWKGSVVSDETVTQRIRLLRQALHDDRRRPRYIETLRNAGYRLVPEVTNVPSVAKKRKPLLRMSVGRWLTVAIAGAGFWLIADNWQTSSLKNSTLEIPLGPVTATELSDKAAILVKQRNPDSLRHAIELYEQALAIEPGNNIIRAALSLALSTSVAWYGDEMEIAARAEQLARQAAANGAFFKAEFALGFSLDAQGKVASARDAYERAVALKPDHYGARASLAYLLQVKGKLVEALSHNMIAFEQAPPGTLDSQVASCLRLLGFSSVASEWLDRTDRLDPDSAHAAPARALDLITRHEFEQARSVISMALARGVEQVELYEYRVVLALLDTDTGLAQEVLDSVPVSLSHRDSVAAWRYIVNAMANEEPREAAAMSEEILSTANADTWPEDFLYAAMLEAAVGHRNNAIAALRRLEAAGFRDHLWLSLLPPLNALHGDQEFDAIVASMRTDVERQHAQILTAEWIPAEWRITELSQINPQSQEE